MNTDKTTILVVEDELAIAELISYTLRAAGWVVNVVTSTAQARESIVQQLPHLILLDWMLPDQSGLRLLAHIRADRQFASLPVIMLTAKSMEEDKLAGLERGADDYITKPFSPRELVARIKTVLRRRAPEQGQDMLVAGDIVLNPANFTALYKNNRIEMGQSEFKLLKFFLAHPNRVFSRSQLLDKVWGNHVDIEDRTVDVHVLRLRKALKAADSSDTSSAEALIKTVRGVGYMFSEK